MLCSFQNRLDSNHRTLMFYEFKPKKEKELKKSEYSFFHMLDI